MENGESSAKVESATKRSTRPLWVRFVHYSIRKARKRKAEKKPETTSDKAARRTANATRAIAFLTLVLAIVSYYQWKEIHAGSTDTHNLAVAAGNQATWTENLAKNMQTQADRTKDLADRMKDQADQTKVIANQAVIQANAAKSAAETAKKALHISERAYITIGLPTLDTETKYIIIPVLNTGHIPSGKVVGTIHEITADGFSPRGINSKLKNTESHWKHYDLVSVPTTGETMNFNVSVPALNADSLKSGHEQIVIVGIISYNDGFPDDPVQEWPFCEGSALLPQSRNLQWVVCDPAVYMPEAMKADHYPDNEYPN